VSNVWYALDATGYCVAEFLSRDYDPHELVERHGRVTIWDRSDNDRPVDTLPNEEEVR